MVTEKLSGLLQQGTDNIPGWCRPEVDSLLVCMGPTKLRNYLRLKYRPPMDPKAPDHAIKLKQFHSLPTVRALRNRRKALRSG